MIRDGLVTSLVNTGDFPTFDYEAKFVTFEKGQTALHVKENLGSVNGLKWYEHQDTYRNIIQSERAKYEEHKISNYNQTENSTRQIDSFQEVSIKHAL